jgi:hypothetical protein
LGFGRDLWGKGGWQLASVKAEWVGACERERMDGLCAAERGNEEWGEEMAGVEGLGPWFCWQEREMRGWLKWGSKLRGGGGGGGGLEKR